MEVGVQPSNESNEWLHSWVGAVGSKPAKEGTLNNSDNERYQWVRKNVKL